MSDDERLPDSSLPPSTSARRRRRRCDTDGGGVPELEMPRSGAMSVDERLPDPSLPPSTSARRRRQRRDADGCCAPGQERCLPGGGGVEPIAALEADCDAAGQVGRHDGAEAPVPAPPTLVTLTAWDVFADDRCVLRPGASSASTSKASASTSGARGDWRCLCGASFGTRGEASRCAWGHAHAAAKLAYEQAIHVWTLGEPGARASVCLSMLGSHVLRQLLSGGMCRMSVALCLQARGWLQARLAQHVAHAMVAGSVPGRLRICAGAPLARSSAMVRSLIQLAAGLFASMARVFRWLQQQGSYRVSSAT